MDEHETHEEEKIIEEKEKEESPKEENSVSHESHKEDHSKKENLTEKLRKNPWVLSTLVLGVLALVLVLGSFNGFSGKVVSGDDVGEILLNFYSANGAEGLELQSVEEISGVYQVNFLYEGSTVPIFVTKDAKYAGSLNALPQTSSSEPSASQDSQSQEITKSDKPKVELFIMTHCPYGTQAEKGIIPAIKALGDTVDAKIRFVHYFMHDSCKNPDGSPDYNIGSQAQCESAGKTWDTLESDETKRQVCIREEQPDKFYDYLGCFLEDGDSDRCLIEAGVDTTKMNTCVSSGKGEEYYAEDSALSQSYGVRGSPTLVINGVQVSSGRDSASYLNTICSAFNSAPGECSSEVSSATPSPGFGYSVTGAAVSSAQCA